MATRAALVRLRDVQHLLVTRQRLRQRPPHRAPASMRGHLGRLFLVGVRVRLLALGALYLIEQVRLLCVAELFRATAEQLALVPRDLILVDIQLLGELSILGNKLAVLAGKLAVLGGKNIVVFAQSVDLQRAAHSPKCST